jgi:hypothetical protein
VIPATNHDIGGFDVPVEDTCLVQTVQGLPQVGGESADSQEGKARGAHEKGLEVHSLDELHDQIGYLSVHFCIENLHHVRVLYQGLGTGLSHKPSPICGIKKRTLGKSFDRHDAV